MSKLYEVLEAARQEREKLGADRIPEPAFEPVYSRNEAEIIRLYQAIDAALPKEGSRVVQFIGTRAGDGCSTIVRDLASIAANGLRESVLLVDLGKPFEEVTVASDITFRHHLDQPPAGPTSLDGGLRQVEKSSLYITSLCSRSDVSASMVASGYPDLWERLRDRFSLILIDSPPASASPLGFSVLRKTDGVVLVIRAEKTRWPAAVSLKERILAEGGKIIGAVYNDRRYYIPGWLYKYL